MESSCASGILGVVALQQPPPALAGLPALRGLLPQVDELLVVSNGYDCDLTTGPASATLDRIRLISFETNRGAAAAWNAALASADERSYRYLFILDEGSAPSPRAVATALAHMESEQVAAVVQPASRDAVNPFPWNTTASGSLLQVHALKRLGGFDERLFTDDADHEMLDRLIHAGYEVRRLVARTVAYESAWKGDIRSARGARSASAKSVEVPRHGYSAGLLVRRYIRSAPATSGRVLLRTLTAGKHLAGTDRTAAREFASGFLAGAATRLPPAQAAERACPYCDRPLMGRFAAVPDWRFGTDVLADVYWCGSCGALAAGRVPEPEELASWYSDYYTHIFEAPPLRAWSRMWPTPVRQRELEQLRWYFAPRGVTGRFLEVGTGSGERLVQFADAGWVVVGQDVDPEAGHIARQRGIEVRHCSVAELIGKQEPFDLIGLNHVLEHAVDPRELLRTCASLLAPGGRLCIVSPNAQAFGRLVFGRWWFGLEQPRHLAIPTLVSLERATSELGLRRVGAKTASTHATVILGGSLAGRLQKHLPLGTCGRVANVLIAFLGQAVGRAAVVLDPRRGEEVVWIGQRSEP